MARRRTVGAFARRCARWCAALALVCGVVRAQEEPALISEFLHNGFVEAVQADSFVVAAMGGGVAALAIDSSGAERVFVLKSLQQMSEPPLSVRIADSIVVARTASNTFYWFDAAGLPELRPLGSASYEPEIMDYLYRDGVMYFAEEFRGVTAHTVDGFSSLQFRDSTQAPIKTTQLALRGDTLFALDEYNGVLRFLNPGVALDNALEYLWLPFPATSFTLSQEQIVFSDGDNGFKVAPYDGDSLTGPFHATQTVSYAYRTLETDSSYIIISSPNVIEVIDKDDPGDVRFINVQGNTQGATLYRSGSDQVLITPSRRLGLAAYLMTTANYPKDFARYDHPGPVRSLEYINGYLYTAGPESPFEKYDPLGAAGPELLGARSWPSGVSWSDALGDTLYLVDTTSAVDLLWLARTLQDSLPRPINTFGLPSDIDRLEVFPDPPTGRKFFVMRRGTQFFINRAEQGQLFGSTTVATNLGVGVTTLSVAQGRLYHYSTKGIFVVSLLSFFNNIVEIAIVPVPYLINEILPVEDQQRLLLFSPFEVRLMDISTAERHDVLTQWSVVGDYTFARKSGELIYAVGPNSTGVLRYQNGSLQELAHLPVGAISVAGGDGLLFTSDGTSIRVYEFIATGVDDDDFTLEPVVPRGFHLAGNFPNPFNGETVIRLGGSVPRGASASVRVYNILGQLVRELRVDESAATSGEIRWDATDEAGRGVASGVYLARLVGVESGNSLKMIYLK